MPFEQMSLVDSTEKALAAAGHLTDMDIAAVNTLRALARKIDAWDRIVHFALNDVEDSGSRPVVPANDNVSLPTYMKLCEQLGLTPSGRKSLQLKEVRGGGKLQGLRASRPVESGKQPAKRPAPAGGRRVRGAAAVHTSAAEADTAD